MRTKLEPSSIAIVDGEEVRRIALRGRLELMGHLPALFANAGELLAALASGHRFDLLLLSPHDEKTAWGRLCAVCEVLGMPTLLIVPGAHWAAPQPLPDEGSKTAFVDLVVSDAADSELDWRIRALLQRAGAFAQEAAQAQDITLGDYQFFGRQQIVLHRGREIHLQPRQFDLASELFRNVGQVVTRGWLWASLWGRASPREGARALDVCVANVRRKLDLRRENGFMLRAAYKHGYMLCPAEAPPRAGAVQSWSVGTNHENRSS